MNAHLHVASPTDQLEAIVKLYRDGLDLEVLGAFEDHNGFDGVMLGNVEMDYHFEFTHQHGHQVGRAPTKDNLLVFYVPDRKKWDTRCQKMEAAGFKVVRSYNPYWDKAGKAFEDPDGYRVVIQNADWANG